MPIRPTPLVPACYYHLFNRGVNRQPIFFCEENWSYFLREVRHYFSPDAVEIIAYCLMPTHYHILVYVKADNFSVRIMQPFVTAYTKAISQQQNRVGPLFQGRFQSKIIDKSAYLLQLSRYIHLNPVQAGLVKNPEDWAYSSFRDYIGLRKGTLPRPEIVLSGFGSEKEYREYVEEGMTERFEEIREMIIELKKKHRLLKHRLIMGCAIGDSCF
jgi:REP-associated tyrosine transposase